AGGGPPPGGATIAWDRASAPRVAGEPAALRFEVREPDGNPAVLEPYLGMAGHAVVARDDGAVFIHLHPMGTVSTAAQATFTLRRQGDTVTGAIGSRIAAADSAMTSRAHPIAGGTIPFPYGFPQPGKYPISVQVELGGEGGA